MPPCFTAASDCGWSLGTRCAPCRRVEDMLVSVDDLHFELAVGLCAVDHTLAGGCFGIVADALCLARGSKHRRVVEWQVEW